MPLVESKDLMFRRHGICAKALSKLAMRLLSLNRVNRIYDTLNNGEGDFCRRALNYLGVSYTLYPGSIARIPTQGPLIVIANHPTGGVDGLAMLDMLLSVRSDVKTFSNFILNRIEPLRENIFAVNPFDERTDNNAAGVRAAMNHIASGGVLLIFPAGEVSTWRHGFSDIGDREWSRTALKFIRLTKAPVLPVFIHARNTTMFKLAGKIHPLLRTALLPRQTLNKAGKSIRLSVGTPIHAQRLVELESIAAYGDYLRASVDYMSLTPDAEAAKQSKHIIQTDDIAVQPPVDELNKELKSISGDCLLFMHGSFSVYCAPPQRIPKIMVEIGRMREITFRQVGEGTHRGIDTDRYDSYYRQLFVWDNDKDTLVGAYRLGFGDHILAQHGVDGFYTHSLFRYSPQMQEVLEYTIELGRSFVVDRYQRHPTSLLLLWKGIVYVLLRNSHYRYLIGPVTISGEFSSVSKIVIVDYLKRHHYDAELAAQIKPVTGLDGVRADINPVLMDGVKSIELISRIINDIENGERSIPVLIKKYLQLNSRVVGFNVDHDFCDGLDALMLLNLKLVPDNTIAMLSKEITDIDVKARFKDIK